MKIKKVEFSKIHAVLDLIDEFNREKAKRPNEEMLSQIYQSLTNNGGCVVGAYWEHKLVGTCTLNLCPNFSWSGQPYAMIENVIVTQSQRNKGIGKALLTFAKEYAFNAGCYKVALMTGSKKEQTLKFYESAGFTGDKTGFQIRSEM